MKWKRYEIDNWQRLKNEGRELLGKEIIFTEKRDGSNISVWLNNEDVIISSHNLEKCDAKLIRVMTATKEFKRIVEFLKEECETYHHNYIVYGELLQAGKSPTRIELPRKRTKWMLFDIWDMDAKRFLDFTLIYQTAYHFKLPIVKVVDTSVLTTMEEFKHKISEMEKWCKKHKREGVVGKNYSEQIFFKAKIDLPKIKRIKDVQGPQLPSMPEERIMRALQHAWDEVGSEEKWKDKSIAMPIVARHISTEAKEHDFSPPRNMFQIYLNTPIDKINPAKETEK